VSGQILQANSDVRQQQANEVAKAVRLIGAKAIVVGDFNLPEDSPIFQRSLAQMDDAFATGGLGFGWTYRANGTLSRIDHILTAAGWRCERCWTGPDVGSPHRPLIADLRSIE
jgi:endonuclease/exonuclease/phosphatase (EEP) superfamily protein YafD